MSLIFSTAKTDEKCSFKITPISCGSTDRWPCWSLRGLSSAYWPFLIYISHLLEFSFTLHIISIPHPLFVLLLKCNPTLLILIEGFTWSQPNICLFFPDQSLSISRRLGFPKFARLALPLNKNMPSLSYYTFKGIPLARCPFSCKQSHPIDLCIFLSLTNSNLALSLFRTFICCPVLSFSI